MVLFVELVKALVLTIILQFGPLYFMVSGVLVEEAQPNEFIDLTK